MPEEVREAVDETDEEAFSKEVDHILSTLTENMEKEAAEKSPESVKN